MRDLSAARDFAGCQGNESAAFIMCGGRKGRRGCFLLLMFASDGVRDDGPLGYD